MGDFSEKSDFFRTFYDTPLLLDYASYFLKMIPLLNCELIFYNFLQKILTFFKKILSLYFEFLIQFHKSSEAFNSGKKQFHSITQTDQTFHFAHPDPNIAMESKSNLIVTNTVHITHTLDNGNINMLEEIEVTTITWLNSGKLIKKICVNKRQIDDKTAITMSDSNGVKEDSLPPEEMKDFQILWNKNWHPRASNDEIFQALVSD